jgi:hypothetical protein
MGNDEGEQVTGSKILGEAGMNRWMGHKSGVSRSPKYEKPRK